jgi:hypothetical protein
MDKDVTNGPMVLSTPVVLLTINWKVSERISGRMAGRILMKTLDYFFNKNLTSMIRFGNIQVQRLRMSRRSFSPLVRIKVMYFEDAGMATAYFDTVKIRLSTTENGIWAICMEKYDDNEKIIKQSYVWFFFIIGHIAVRS